MQLLVPGSNGDAVEDVGRAYAIFIPSTQTRSQELQKLTMIRCLPGPSQIYTIQCERCTNTTSEGERGADGDAVDDASDDCASDWRL